MEIAATAREAGTLSKSCSYRMLQLLQEAVSLRNLRENCDNDDDGRVVQELQRKLLLGCLTDSILIANAAVASSSNTSSSSGVSKKDESGIDSRSGHLIANVATSSTSSRRKVSDYFRSNFTIHR